MLSFKEFILLETPLPDDWNKSNLKTTEDAISYIIKEKKLDQLGEGSSRKTFNLKPSDFKNSGIKFNRDSALKIAYNQKGIAQNIAEINLIKKAKKSDLIIPYVDYDDSDKPIWIQYEVADLIKDEKEPIFNGRSFNDLLHTSSLYDLIVYAQFKQDGSFKNMKEISLNRIRKYNDYDDSLMQDFYDIVDELVKVSDVTKLVLSDLDNIENWGIYKGRPVIIDFGLDEESVKHYEEEEE